MQESHNIPFEFGYDSDTLFSYAVLELDDRAELLKHQVEMIAQNPNPVFIPFNVRQENEKVRIYYNITSKISLSQFLSRRTLSKKEFLDMLKNLNKGLLGHTNYLLDISGFVLDESFIFINLSSCEISLVYVPVPVERNFIKDYKAFVTNLIVNSASLEDSANDNFLQKILNYIKSDIFSLNDFNRLIADLRVSGGGMKNENGVEDVFYGNGAAFINEKPGKAESGNMLSSSKNRLLRILLPQALIILASAIIFIVLVSKNMADISTIFGFVLIAASLDAYVLSKTVFKKENNAAENSSQINGKQVQISKKETGSRAVRDKDSRKPAASGGGPGHSASGTAVDYIRANDTVVISEHSGGYPYLSSIGTQASERIAICKDKFVIGRLKSYVDYAVQSSSVGKVHAEIIKVDDSYYVKDLNSKNGTYINDARIPSNKEHEIKADDRIRFANLEYVFKA
ncbi:MAG: DUF6382 domain-containing protein [Caulobacteraceae bacterium]